MSLLAIGATAALRIPAYSFLFRLRGTTAKGKMTPEDGKPTFMNELKDFLPKPVIFFIMSLFVFPPVFFLTGNWKAAAAAFLAHFAGSFLQYLPELGKYFPFSPKNTSGENGEWIVDAITNALRGKYTAETSPEDGRKWRTFAMRVRWGLYSVPKYALVSGAIIGLAGFSPIHLLPLLIPVMMLLVGNIYDEANEGAKAEWISGGYIGAAETLCL